MRCSAMRCNSMQRNKIHNTKIWVFYSAYLLWLPLTQQQCWCWWCSWWWWWWFTSLNFNYMHFKFFVHLITSKWEKRRKKQFSVILCQNEVESKLRFSFHLKWYSLLNGKGESKLWVCKQKIDRKQNKEGT